MKVSRILDLPHPLRSRITTACRKVNRQCHRTTVSLRASNKTRTMSGVSPLLNASKKEDQVCCWGEGQRQLTEESFRPAFGTGDKTLFQESKSDRLAKIRSFLLTHVNLRQEKQQARGIDYLRTACYKFLPSPAKNPFSKSKDNMFSVL